MLRKNTLHNKIPLPVNHTNPNTLFYHICVLCQAVSRFFQQLSVCPHHRSHKRGNVTATYGADSSLQTLRGGRKPCGRSFGEARFISTLDLRYNETAIRPGTHTVFRPGCGTQSSTRLGPPIRYRIGYPNQVRVGHPNQGRMRLANQGPVSLLL
jgi:hypothetical protein